jgi:hypothetical protein
VKLKIIVMVNGLTKKYSTATPSGFNCVEKKKLKSKNGIEILAPKCR